MTTTVASGGLLPGVQQFLDNSGAPLVGGTLTWYVQGTQILASVWTNATLTTPAPNPTPLDAGGVPQAGGAECQLYGAGAYTLVVTSAAGAVVRTLQISLGGPQQGVATVAALRALTAPPGSGLVFVNGYHSAADGGEGWFELVAGDTTSADNGGTILVDAAGDRWYRAGAAAFTRYSVKWFGAYVDGVHDDTAALRNCVAAIGLAGGGTADIPSGQMQLSGTIAITTAGTIVAGAGQMSTTLNFAAGSYDWFTIIGPSYGSLIRGCQVNDLTMKGLGATGGRVALWQYAWNGMMQRVYVFNCWNGVESLSNNNVTLRDVTFNGVTSGSGGWGLYFHAPADGTADNIEFDLDRVTVNCLWSGADGLRWDGPAYTLNAYNTTFLDVAVGIHVLNTAESNEFYPEFGEFVDCTVDGASSGSVGIAGGGNFKFTGCNIQNTSGEAGQGGADTYAVFLAQDAGASITHEIMFVNCFIGLAKGGAVGTAAANVLFSNCRFGAATTSAANAVDAITVTTGGSDTQVNGCVFSYIGNPNNFRYGINIAAGTFRTTSVGCNFNVGCQTAGYLNSSGDPDTFVNLFIGPPNSEPGAILLMPPMATLPSNPGVGQVVYNTTTNHFEGWNGTSWVQLDN